MANNCNKTFRDMIESGQAQVLGIVSIVPMGDWNTDILYNKLNVVSHNNAVYCAKNNNMGVEPGVSDNWETVWMFWIAGSGGGQEEVSPDGTYPNMTVGKVMNALLFGNKSYDGSSPQTITAEDLGLGSAYIPQGSIPFASLPATPSVENLGYVWDITNNFTTDSRFVEGDGKQYSAGANVGVIKQNGNYYYDVLGNFVDLSNYATKAEVSAKYTKPSSGIPESDLSQAVQNKLNAADEGLTNAELIVRADTLPEANANSPDFVQVGETLYQKIITGEAYTVNVGDTFYFSDVIAGTDDSGFSDPSVGGSERFGFTSNGNTYYGIWISNEEGYNYLRYYESETGEGSNTVFDALGGWTNQAYRTVTFTEKHTFAENFWNVLNEYGDFTLADPLAYTYVEMGGEPPVVSTELVNLGTLSASGSLTAEQVQQIGLSTVGVTARAIVGGVTRYYERVSIQGTTALLVAADTAALHVITVNMSTNAYTLSDVPLGGNTPAIPTPSASDNGKVLGVESGAYALIEQDWITDESVIVRMSALPATVDETSPDFVEVSGILYRKKYVVTPADDSVLEGKWNANEDVIWSLSVYNFDGGKVSTPIGEWNNYGDKYIYGAKYSSDALRYYDADGSTENSAVDTDDGMWYNSSPVTFYASADSYSGASDLLAHMKIFYIKADSESYLYEAIGEVPLANGTNAGTVNPVAKTDGMTQEVGVGTDGKLYTAPSGGGADVPTPTVQDAGKVLSVNSAGEYALVDGGGVTTEANSAGGTTYTIKTIGGN